MTLTVRQVGASVLVQDRGRAGWAHLGVPRSGALDAPAAALANRLVGNLPDDACLELVLGGLAMPVLYAVLRRFPRGWPVIGSVVAVLFLVIAVVIAPVFIAPLFNRFTPLEDARIRDPILRLAHANGIATDRVYVQDASRQTTRISAYVSGLLGSERIVLNDNLLHRGTLLWWTWI